MPSMPRCTPTRLQEWQHFFSALAPGPAAADVLQQLLRRCTFHLAPDAFRPVALLACDLLVQQWLISKPWSCPDDPAEAAGGSAAMAAPQEAFSTTLHWLLALLQPLHAWVRHEHATAGGANSPAGASTQVRGSSPDASDNSHNSSSTATNGTNGTNTTTITSTTTTQTTEKCNTNSVTQLVEQYARLYENVGQCLLAYVPQRMPSVSALAVALGAYSAEARPASSAAAPAAGGNTAPTAVHSSSTSTAALLAPVHAIRAFLALGTDQQIELHVRLRLFLLHFYHAAARAQATQELATIIAFLGGPAVAREMAFFSRTYEFSNTDQRFTLLVTLQQRVRHQRTLQRSRHTAAAAAGRTVTADVPKCAPDGSSPLLPEHEQQQPDLLHQQLGLSKGEMSAAMLLHVVAVCVGGGCDGVDDVEGTAVAAVLSSAPAVCAHEVAEQFLAWAAAGKSVHVPSAAKDAALEVCHTNTTTQDSLGLFMRLAAAMVNIMPEKVLRGKWCERALRLMQQLSRQLHLRPSAGSQQQQQQQQQQKQQQQQQQVPRHGFREQPDVRDSLHSLAVCSFNDGVGFARELQFVAAEHAASVAVQLLSADPPSELKRSIAKGYEMLLQQLQQSNAAAAGSDNPTQPHTTGGVGTRGSSGVGAPGGSSGGGAAGGGTNSGGGSRGSAGAGAGAGW
jgi:hypothetical protein